MPRQPLHRRLGKLPPKDDLRTLKLSSFIEPARVPKVAGARDWLAGHEFLALGALGNNVAGNCTIAAAGHAIQVWTLNTLGVPRLVTSDEALALYSKLAGYNPQDPSTDQGAYALDILKAWRGEGLFGESIAAFLALDPHDAAQMDFANDVFGGVYLGLNLPLAAQDQDIWQVPRGGWPAKEGPGSWGGHAVWMHSHSPRMCVVNTWGLRKAMTREFVTACCDEAYVVLWQGWVAANGRTPAGLDLDALRAALVLVTQQ
jgi:hypothetical protein